MNVHFVRFPRWESIVSCARTVFHVPVIKLQGAGYHRDDILVATSTEDKREVVICRIIDVRVGPLMGFIGNVQPDSVLKKLTPELRKLDTTWVEFERSWQKVHGINPQTSPEVVRVEFGYETLPLSPEVLGALRRVEVPLPERELLDVIIKVSLEHLQDNELIKDMEDVIGKPPARVER
jgi:hypothetical protein